MSGKSVWVRDCGREVEVHHGGERIAVHSQAPHRHGIVTRAEHHRGIPLGARVKTKILIRIQDTALVVEIRSLAACESAALGGGR
jgi:hypothetical protein